MKKKTVKLVFSVVILAAACGAYFGVKHYVNKQEELENQETEEKTSVFSAETENITTLGFMIDEKEVTFVKDGDSWIKEDEREFPVSQSKLDTVVDRVTSIEAERVLENVEDLSEYGLDEPSNAITIKEKGDETEKVTVLYVGDRNDSTGQYYMSKGEDEKTVYLASETVIEPFTDTLYAFAETETFPVVDTSSVKRIQVEGENSYVLEKENDTGFWNIGTSSSDMEKSDSAKAGSLVSSIGNLAYDKFVNYNAEDLSEYGLDNPYAVIMVDYEEEQETEEEDALDEESEKTMETITVEKQLIVSVGNECEGDTRYVSVNGSSQIYTISNDTLAAFLEKTDSDFWDMTVNYLSINNLESLQIEHSGETHQINVSRETSVKEPEDKETSDGDSADEVDGASEKEPETVEIVTYRLDGEDFEETAFKTFYNKLINISGQRRLTEKFEPETDAEMTVTFTSTANAKTEVNYYAYDSNFYAAAVNEKVYLVNKMTVKDMMNAYDEMMKENQAK